MIFKELRPALPIYIFDKSSMTYTQGKVVNANGPRYNANVQQPGSMPSFNMPQMVMDVTVEAGGKTTTYQLPDNVGAAAVGSMLIATDKSSILAELQATKANCEDYLAGVDKKKEMLAKCENLIEELDTSFKERKQFEDRISAVESTQTEQNKKLDKILDLLSGKNKKD